MCDTALTCGFADSQEIINADQLQVALNELQWSKYSKPKNEPRSQNAIDTDSLYDDISTSESLDGDVHETVNGAYIAIASRSLVEISRQLKRIADHLESK